MKKVFVAYADENCKYSLERIGKQAKRLGYFDDIILYTKETLPEEALNHPLINERRGGGYWVWKPIIIKEVLSKMAEGDIVVYVDSGCTLNKSYVWNMMFRLLDRYDTICFQYNSLVAKFKNRGTMSSKMKYWTKRQTIDYFIQKYNDSSFLEFNQVMGGILFLKGKENAFLNEWYNLTMNHPELLTDVKTEELPNQYDGFVAHRHDQSILTPIAEYDAKTLVLPQSMEDYKDSFICASRIRAKTKWDYYKWKSKLLFWSIIGKKGYTFMNSIFSKNQR